LLLVFIFRSNKIDLTLEAHFNESISINGSKNAGSGGGISSHRRPTGVRVQVLSTLR